MKISEIRLVNFEIDTRHTNGCDNLRATHERNLRNWIIIWHTRQVPVFATGNNDVSVRSDGVLIGVQHETATLVLCRHYGHEMRGAEQSY